MHGEDGRVAGSRLRSFYVGKGRSNQGTTDRTFVHILYRNRGIRILSCGRCRLFDVAGRLVFFGHRLDRIVFVVISHLCNITRRPSTAK